MRDKNSSSFGTIRFTSRASSWIHEVHAEKKVGHQSELIKQSPCKIEYKKYCLKGCESFHLFDEDIIGCKSPWFHEKNVVKSTCGGAG